MVIEKYRERSLSSRVKLNCDVLKASGTTSRKSWLHSPIAKQQNLGNISSPVWNSYRLKAWIESNHQGSPSPRHDWRSLQDGVVLGTAPSATLFGRRVCFLVVDWSMSKLWEFCDLLKTSKNPSCLSTRLFWHHCKRKDLDRWNVMWFDFT